VVGQVAPSLVRRRQALLDISWLGISSQGKNCASGIGTCPHETVNGNTLVFPQYRRRLEGQQHQARSLITQMETVKVQSAELRHFGVERSGETRTSWRSRVGCGCRVGRQDRESQSIVRVWTPTSVAVPCLTTSCELTLLYASLLEEYDCGEEITFRGNLHWDVRRTYPSAIKGDGSARSCSVWRECSDLPYIFG
jgi:hypothetical protein